MRLNDFKIGARVAALATVMALASVLTGTVATFALKADMAQMDANTLTASEFERAVDLARTAQVTFKIQIQEWKNLLLRGGKAESFDKYSQAFHTEGQATQARLNELKAVLTRLGMDTAKVSDAQAALETLNQSYTQALAHYKQADADQSAHAVDALVKGQDRPPTQKIDEIVKGIVAAAAQSRAASLAQAQAHMGRAMASMLAVLVASLAFGLGAAWLIWRSITGPLHQLVDMASEVAAGRLSAKVHNDQRDELGQLTRAMGSMSDSLHKVVTQVRASAEQVLQASGEIAQGNMDLSNRTELQSSHLQQAASAIEHLSGGVRQSAEHATHAETLASQASTVAERGGSVVKQVVQTMSDIDISSRKISEIIGVIDGIAFQTNILALNAAVEAARAGEQGRGFAVVASEVRALAQRSANAAREIKVLINDSVACVQRGSGLVGDAGQTMASVVQAVQQVREVVSEITVAVQEQAGGIGQVSQSIGRIDMTMQQNAALVEQAAAASSSLREQAQALQGAVGFFRA